MHPSDSSCGDCSDGGRHLQRFSPGSAPQLDACVAGACLFCLLRDHVYSHNTSVALRLPHVSAARLHVGVPSSHPTSATWSSSQLLLVGIWHWATWPGGTPLGPALHSPCHVVLYGPHPHAVLQHMAAVQSTGTWHVDAFLGSVPAKFEGCPWWQSSCNSACETRACSCCCAAVLLCSCPACSAICGTLPSASPPAVQLQTCHLHNRYVTSRVTFHVTNTTSGARCTRGAQRVLVLVCCCCQGGGNGVGGFTLPAPAPKPWPVPQPCLSGAEKHP